MLHRVSPSSVVFKSNIFNEKYQSSLPLFVSRCQYVSIAGCPFGELMDLYTKE